MSDETRNTETESAGAQQEGQQVALSRGGRHAGREVALQVLYALDLGETGPRDAEAARAAKEAEEARRPTGPRSQAAPYPGRPSETTFRADREAAASPRDVPTSSSPGEAGAARLDPVEASRAAFDRITEHFSVPGSAIAFARELVAGVAARSEELDRLVGAHARNWRVSRMAAVDRNVLRLAVYELRDTDTPVAVVIDEAVDLARRFGSDTSPSFVNGILDAVAREVRAA